MCVCVCVHACVYVHVCDCTCVCDVTVSKEQCASVVRAHMCMLRQVQESLAVCGVGVWG